LWAEFDPQRLATPEAFERDPDLVWGWYRWRTALVAQASPHAGHRAIAQLARLKPKVTVITQNVDDLHERAGSSGVLHLHGSLFAPRCLVCSRPHEDPSSGQNDPVTGGDEAHGAATSGTPALRVTPPACVHCGGTIRPGIVWFGESLPMTVWQPATDALEECDALLVVGTSGVVQPAASLPRLVRRRGKPVIEINPAPSEITPIADIHWSATAAEGLPQVVELLKQAASRGNGG
jgi:NAD-dependent deacetylase